MNAPIGAAQSWQQWVGLLVSIGLCFAAAGIGSLFTTPEIRGWYAAISKPTWTPPAWLFGPVWTTLYAMMGIAAWLVWRERGFAGASLPLALFAAQLVLNTLWSVIFFGMHRTGLAFLDIALLWLAILATTLAFWPISRVAGALLLPYLLWVSFAAALNYSIWRMN
jgi:tryptophan-rich sensory protein